MKGFQDGPLLSPTRPHTMTLKASEGQAAAQIFTAWQAIKNCPSMQESYGNIQDISLLEVVLNEEFRQVWHIHKDQINTCRDCEFRYICSDCRAFTKDLNTKTAKPLKCRYNPYKAQWE